MADFDKKVQPSDHDPYEHIPISPIEKDKKGKEEYPKRFPEDPNKPHIFAALLSFFKKMAFALGFKGGGDLTFVGYHQLFEHLGAFRSQLRILAQQDESYNPEFTQQLSELWHNLIDDCNSVSASLDISSRTEQSIKFLISQISHYPPEADHTLGYYFDAYAGKEWIPFPFMDMLRHLHQEHQASPTESHLSKWLLLLDDILSWEQGEKQ